MIYCISKLVKFNPTKIRDGTHPLYLSTKEFLTLRENMKDQFNIHNKQDGLINVKSYTTKMHYCIHPFQ